MRDVKINVPHRTIFNQDNIDILRGINSSCVDLIYLDPPFNKKKVFTAPIGSSAEGAAFSDIFRQEDVKDEWVYSIRFENHELHAYLMGVKAFSNLYNYCYLVYMAIRLIECRRILKHRGTIYLHCDPTMSHYLKVVMDCIFGERNFRNEIVWCYRGAGYPKRDFGKRHDILFRYSKTGNCTFNLDAVREQYAEATVDRFKHHIGNVRKGGDFGTQKLNPLGKHPDDWWQIQPIAPSAKERTGYPTQKPLALLERIIKASSSAGDVVLDPFCGCATTCVAAERLDRKWIGIDISIEAYNLVQKRLDREVPALEKVMWSKEIVFSTVPPARTDQTLAENIEQGYIYIISHPVLTPHYAEGKTTYKVGVAKDFEKRLASYQTYAPGEYVAEYKRLTPKYKEIEKAIFERFNGDRKNEWITAAKEDIIAAIEELL